MFIVLCGRVQIGPGVILSRFKIGARLLFRKCGLDDVGTPQHHLLPTRQLGGPDDAACGQPDIVGGFLVLAEWDDLLGVRNDGKISHRIQRALLGRDACFSVLQCLEEEIGFLLELIQGVSLGLVVSHGLGLLLSCIGQAFRRPDRKADVRLALGERGVVAVVVIGDIESAHQRACWCAISPDHLPARVLHSHLLRAAEGDESTFFLNFEASGSAGELWVRTVDAWQFDGGLVAGDRFGMQLQCESFDSHS
mmetsp:Transcript_2645/g.7345  ORF Transcript_2645/g.7345 Transcript_2645/m.7345 type:complete len:251 (+) Transcript_2645:41-793(+)